MSSNNTTTTKNPKAKSQFQSQSQTQEERPHLSANFAHPSSQRIDYDHEVYLHLMSGDDGGDTRKDKNKSKTPNQVYREVSTIPDFIACFVSTMCLFGKLCACARVYLILGVSLW